VGFKRFEKALGAAGEYLFYLNYVGFKLTFGNGDIIFF